LQYKYININKFRSLLFEANFKVQKNQFSLAANASYYGIGKELFSGTLVSPDDFFYTFEGKLAANYTLPKQEPMFRCFTDTSGNFRCLS
jgi:outer membrane receptor for ferrienterochelin and colicins